MDERTQTYTESDFVTVVDETGVVQENKIPKQWLGTDLAPGVKKATRAQISKADGVDDSGDSGDSNPPSGSDTSNS